MFSLVKKFLAGLAVVALLAGTAYGGGQNVRTYSMSIYTAGYLADSDNTGTTIPAVGHDSQNGTPVSGGSKFFTWVADGSFSNANDRRTFDVNDFNPNWRSMTLRVNISSVTSVATSDNSFDVRMLTCTELTDTNCEWDKYQYGPQGSSGVSWVGLYDNSNNTAGTSNVVVPGVSSYPIDISASFTPETRYFRLLFMSGNLSTSAAGGASQYPGSPAGTTWANEVGPKAWLVVTSY
jgi:hypothetical protein